MKKAIITRTGASQWKGRKALFIEVSNLSRPVLLETETETGKASFEQASAAFNYANVSKYFVPLKLYLEKLY
jgi:hypothetical protein